MSNAALDYRAEADQIFGGAPAANIEPEPEIKSVSGPANRVLGISQMDIYEICRAEDFEAIDYQEMLEHPDVVKGLTQIWIDRGRFLRRQRRVADEFGFIGAVYYKGERCIALREAAAEVVDDLDKRFQGNLSGPLGRVMPADHLAMDIMAKQTSDVVTLIVKNSAVFAAALISSLAQISSSVVEDADWPKLTSAIALITAREDVHIVESTRG